MAIPSEAYLSVAVLVAPILVGVSLGLAADAASDTSSAPGTEHKNGAFRAACGADLTKFCPAAGSREDRHACLEANKDKFSDGCKTFMAEHPWGKRNDQQRSSTRTTN